MKGKTLFKAGLLTGILMFLVCLPLLSTAQEKVRLQVLSTKMGTGGYAMGHALSQIVNKHHPWLRVDNLETSGMLENVRTLAQDKARRKNTLQRSQFYGPIAILKL